MPTDTNKDIGTHTHRNTDTHILTKTYTRTHTHTHAHTHTVTVKVEASVRPGGHSVTTDLLTRPPAPEKHAACASSRRRHTQGKTGTHCV